MISADPIPFAIGDILVLKKPHPCGSKEWRVLKLGADLRLVCLGCGRHIMLPRAEAERRLKKLIKETNQE